MSKAMKMTSMNAAIKAARVNLEIMFAPRTEQIVVIADHKDRVLSCSSIYDCEGELSTLKRRWLATAIAYTTARYSQPAVKRMLRRSGQFALGRCCCLPTNRTTESATANMALTSSNGPSIVTLNEAGSMHRPGSDVPVVA
jgi:hypothetical protein